jgi:hypothetical protein
MFPNKLLFKENKSLTSNWSRGLNTKFTALIYDYVKILNLIFK